MDQSPAAPEDPAPTARLPEDEFVALLTSHQGLLHSFIISQLPGEQSVDDIFQQANMVLWQKRAQFEAGTNFRAWALTVARWEIRAWLVSQKRGAWLSFSDRLSDALIESYSDAADPQAGGGNPRSDALRQCLAKLKASDRLLVLSHYQNRKSLDECARIFRRTAGSLKVALFRIRQVLRRCVNAQLSLERARS